MHECAVGSPNLRRDIGRGCSRLGCWGRYLGSRGKS